MKYSENNWRTCYSGINKLREEKKEATTGARGGGERREETIDCSSTNLIFFLFFFFFFSCFRSVRLGQQSDTQTVPGESFLDAFDKNVSMNANNKS